jgi:photosystem II stability/assembly factor-like uncharacterized protein
MVLKRCISNKVNNIAPKTMRQKLIIIFLFISLTFGAMHSAECQWTNVSPKLLGITFGYAAFCYKDGIVWAGNRSLFFSNDSGITWKPGGISGLHVPITSIAFFDDKTGLIADWDGNISLTLDQGLNWKLIHQNFPIPTVCFMGSSSDIIVVADDSVYTSRDQGLTWKTMFVANWQTDAICDKPGHVIVLGGDQKSKVVSLFISSDYGSSWQRQPGNVNLDSYSFAIDSCDHNRIYIANENAFSIADTLSRIYVSRDNGNTWGINAIFPRPFFSGSVANSNNAIYCPTTSNGIFRSTDFGKTWASIGGTNQWYDSRDICVLNDNMIIASDSAGNIWRTINGGGNPLPDPLSISTHVLFADDSLDACNAALTRFIKIKTFGCNVPSISSTTITGKDSASYSVIPLAGDSLGVSFKPLNFGTQNATVKLTLSDGTLDTISLQGVGVGIVPHQLSLVTTDQATDTIGGSIDVPITIVGLDHVEDVELVLHYDNWLTHDSTFSSTTRFDIPNEQWTGRSKLHISQAKPDTILGYARFNTFGDSIQSHVTFDSVTVFTAVSPCQYIPPVSVTSTVTPPSGCGVQTLTNYLRDGTVPQLSIMPNPSNGEIAIFSTSDLGMVNVAIYDMLGIKQSASTYMFQKSHLVKIFLSSVNGLYNVVVRSVGMNFDLRVVVNR